ncbi:MAG: serine/threonine-protein kinase [Pseudomonadota bacterium]
MTHPPDDDPTALLPGQAAAAAGADGVPHNALANGTRLGEFNIIGLLGEGGFGIVYLAYDSSLGRHVAIKEYMPAEFASRTVQAEVRIKAKHHTESFAVGLRSFVNEAHMLARFDHPSLLKVYRFWEANGTAYMVMPYYKGPTLKQALLARDGPPAEAWLRNLLEPLLETLALLHAQNCFHRDIAPDNILLLDDGRPLLLDFGAARRALSEKTQAFTVILKPAYAPIEQYAETPGMHQGAWTDLFALAAVVHFAIDGRPPPSAAGRAIADPYVPLARRYAGQYSPQFLAAIDRALSFRPADRPQSVADMRALLGHGMPLPDPPRKRRRRLLAAGIAGCAMAAVVGGGFYFVKQSAAPQALAPQVAAAAPAAAAKTEIAPAPVATKAQDIEALTTELLEAVSETPAAPAPVRIACTEIGRFASDAQARDFRRQLGALAVGDVEALGGALHRVYIPGFPTEAEANRKGAQQNFAFTVGRFEESPEQNKWAIVLGDSLDRRQADALQAKLNRQGINHAQTVAIFPAIRTARLRVRNIDEATGRSLAAIVARFPALRMRRCG